MGEGIFPRQAVACRRHGSRTRHSVRVASGVTAMETKANYVLIGFFTLGVLAAAFAFVHWFRSIGRATVSASYHVVFQGPVGGLRTGASVLFNGMRVGEV